VLGEFPTEARHVRGLPSKDVPICMGELNEHVFLCFV
jgi:hypothetical protein